jgi:hypothetical protein
MKDEEPEQEILDAEHKPLAVVEAGPPPTLFSQMAPAMKLAFAREVATTLRQMLIEGKIVIDENGNQKRKPLIVRVPQKVNGHIVGYSEHVEVEGWLTCGMLAGGATAPIRWTKPLEGPVEGYRAFCEVVANGVVLGSATGRCDRSESKWKNRDAFQLESMAQTRAQSKALGSVFRWIMTLAGFSPTPAEEVPREGFNDKAPRTRAKPAPPEPSEVSGDDAADLYAAEQQLPLVRSPRRPQPSDDDTPENRARGLKAVHALADELGLDINADDSIYRRLLLEDPAFSHHFMDPAVEVSSKELTYSELRRFYAALKESAK